MSRKGIIYTSFFLILFVGFYFILTRAIPGFGKKKIPAISFIHPFAFTNQDGKTVTEKNVEGKVFVAEYFYTSCKAICPKMNNNMRKVYERFKDNDDFIILSHTSDPETDSAAQLKKFSDSMGVNTSKWIFLTGRKDSLYQMARNSYAIDDPVNNLKSIDDQFLHTQFWALVNRDGDVKKIYDGLKDAEVQQMISDISKLLKD